MSAGPSPLNNALFSYIAERTSGDDDFLQELKREATAADIPKIQISPAQGSFMQVLLRAAGAKEVIEVGTLAGYSALWMARALPEGGRVRTVEFDPKHAAFAREWAGRSDVADKIEVHEGAGMDVLPGFADASADASFIDADKVNYPGYLEESIRIVRPGGLILCDNAFAFGELLDESSTDDSVLAIRKFNDIMAADSRVEGLIVPVGDGCWVATRK